MAGSKPSAKLPGRLTLGKTKPSNKCILKVYDPARVQNRLKNKESMLMAIIVLRSWYTWFAKRAVERSGTFPRKNLMRELRIPKKLGNQDNDFEIVSKL
jgi:hypothetical protein